MVAAVSYFDHPLQRPQAAGADEIECVPCVTATATAGREMARGKAKLKKGQRASSKATTQPLKSAKAAAASAAAATVDLTPTTKGNTHHGIQATRAESLSDASASPRNYHRGLGEISDVFSNAYDSGYGSHEGDGFSENCDQ